MMDSTISSKLLPSVCERMVVFSILAAGKIGWAGSMGFEVRLSDAAVRPNDSITVDRSSNFPPCRTRFALALKPSNAGDRTATGVRVAVVAKPKLERYLRFLFRIRFTIEPTARKKILPSHRHAVSLHDRLDRADARVHLATTFILHAVLTLLISMSALPRVILIDVNFSR
jgi:hypothetical protein